MFILRESEIEKIVNFFYLMFTIYYQENSDPYPLQYKSSIRFWIKSFSPHLSRPLSSDYTVLYRGREYLFSKFSMSKLFSLPCNAYCFRLFKTAKLSPFWIICSFPNKTTDNETASLGCKIVTFLAQKCHFTRRKYGLQNDILCILEESK